MPQQAPHEAEPRRTQAACRLEAAAGRSRPRQAAARIKPGAAANRSRLEQIRSSTKPQKVAASRGGPQQAAASLNDPQMEDIVQWEAIGDSNWWHDLFEMSCPRQSPLLVNRARRLGLGFDVARCHGAPFDEYRANARHHKAIGENMRRPVCDAPNYQNCHQCTIELRVGIQHRFQTGEGRNFAS